MIVQTTQKLQSGITIRQDFRDAARFVMFDTGIEGAEYATHGGTAFIVLFKGCPYGITALHIRGDFRWNQIALTNLKFGDEQAGLSHVVYPSAAHTQDAEGTEMLDVAVVRFADDVDASFFKDSAFVLDTGTIAGSQKGDSLLVNGAIKELSSTMPGPINAQFALLEFLDAGNSRTDPVLREAYARFRGLPFQSVAGISGAPVFNKTRNALCGMVTRGVLAASGDCTIHYVDIFDIMKFVEAAHAGQKEFAYQKRQVKLERKQAKLLPFLTPPDGRA